MLSHHSSRFLASLVGIFLLSALSSCSSPSGKGVTPNVAPVAPPRPNVPIQRGQASFYSRGFEGRKTANGEIYRCETLTAAHRTLPFGTKVKVKNLNNGREVIVRINNRGPFIRKRIIDLSKRAARELNMIKSGVAPVEVTVLEMPAKKR